MRTLTARLCVSLLAAAAAPAAGTAQARSDAVEVVAFVPETRERLPGDSATSELTVRSAAAESRTVWIGYSVRDPAGAGHDVLPVSLSLAANAEGAVRLSFAVPRDAAEGPYRVAMSVWSRSPGPDAERLAGVERADAFRVRAQPGARLSDGRWVATSHPLGRGSVVSAHVAPRGDGFALTLPAGRCDGAEIRSRERFGFGRYGARLRTPNAPGSLSAFFLYADVDGPNDEIDIEIFNDGSRRVLLTSWIAGEKAREATAELPFDPAERAHDYEIDWTASELVFRADGRSIARWTESYPRAPMRLMANVWWPSWLPCDPPGTDRALVIERIGEAPVESR